MCAHRIIHSYFSYLYIRSRPLSLSAHTRFRFHIILCDMCLRNVCLNTRIWVYHIIIVRMPTPRNYYYDNFILCARVPREDGRRAQRLPYGCIRGGPDLKIWTLNGTFRFRSKRGMWWSYNDVYCFLFFFFSFFFSAL